MLTVLDGSFDLLFDALQGTDVLLFGEYIFFLQIELLKGLKPRINGTSGSIQLMLCELEPLDVPEFLFKFGLLHLVAVKRTPGYPAAAVAQHVPIPPAVISKACKSGRAAAHRTHRPGAGKLVRCCKPTLDCVWLLRVLLPGGPAENAIERCFTVFTLRQGNFNGRVAAVLLVFSKVLGRDREDQQVAPFLVVPGVNAERCLIKPKTDEGAQPDRPRSYQTGEG